MMLRRPFMFSGALVLFALASGCGGPEEPSLQPEQVTDFQKLFATNCAGCHGTDGRHGAAPPLNDPLYQSLIGTDELQTVISLGRSGTPMPAFAKSAGGTLTDQQILVLADEMKKRWAKPEAFSGLAIPPYSSAGAGDAQRGQAVFETYCAKCHGAGGRGGPIAGSIVDPAYLSLVSDQILRTTVIVGRPFDGMPDWRNRAAHAMQPQEISDVVAWLVSHRTAAATPAKGTATEP